MTDISDSAAQQADLRIPPGQDDPREHPRPHSAGEVPTATGVAVGARPAPAGQEPPADDRGEVLRQRADDVVEVLDALSEVLLAEEDTPAVLARIVDLAVRTVPGCDAAGITLLHDGKPETAAYTDERTLVVDSRQYDVGDGPCLEAARTGRTTRVDVEEATEQWPDFSEGARRAGVRSYLAAPVALGEEPMGALNLYSRSPDGFEPVDEAFVALFTAQVAVALASARRTHRARTLASQMSEAMASRAVIEQAKGILMAQHGVDAEGAFDLLREDSQRRNVKLRELAQRLVASAVTPLATAGDSG